MKALIFLFSLTILISCSTNDDAGDVKTNEFEQIVTILPQDQWKVTRYYEANEDRTNDFESFIFLFDADGTVLGQNDLFTENGTWAYKSTPENGEQLVLRFDGTVPFDQIIGDWDIISLGNAKVELAYGELNNVPTKLLTFSKI